MWYNKKELGKDDEELDKIWYDSEDQLKANEYYFFNLCGYSTKLHKPFAEYVARKEKEKEDQNNFFAGIMQDDSNDSVTTNLDMSWLDNY